MFSSIEIAQQIFRGIEFSHRFDIVLTYGEPGHFVTEFGKSLCLIDIADEIFRAGTLFADDPVLGYVYPVVDQRAGFKYLRVGLLFLITDFEQLLFGHVDACSDRVKRPA